MNEYRWSDIAIGLKHEFEAVFTAEDAQAFAALSGDTNPLHSDETYSLSAGFSGPVLFGMAEQPEGDRAAGGFRDGGHRPHCPARRHRGWL